MFRTFFPSVNSKVSGSEQQFDISFALHWYENLLKVTKENVRMLLSEMF